MTLHFSSEPVSDATPARPIPKPGPVPVRGKLLSSQESDHDAPLEQTIRPQTLAEYIGQPALKENLRIGLAAAQQRQEPLDHLLFYGPPGIGKTTLAMVLAHEMGVESHITSAPALERPRDIIGLLMGLQPGAVIFIDEIHRLNKVTEEILYPAMEDYSLDRTVGKGASARILRVPLPKFTLVGATTQAGSISNPLRDRFGHVYRLGYYEQPELMEILLRSAAILGIALTREGAEAIARRARGTPRIANRLLKRVRDFIQVTPGLEGIDGPAAEQALALYEIDAHGLDPTDRQLLTLMIQNFSGGPVGLETLAAALGEDARTLEDVYEPYLLQCGLLMRTPRGRMVTAKTFEHLGLMPPPHLQQALDAQTRLPL